MSEAKDYRYSKEHEWAFRSDEGFVVGITDYAQQELGDVVFVDLPQPGSAVKAGQSFATIESVKAVSEIYAPLDGKIVKVNEALADKSELVNTAAEKEGWIVVIEAADPGQFQTMMTAEQYAAYVKEVAK